MAHVGGDGCADGIFLRPIEPECQVGRRIENGPHAPAPVMNEAKNVARCHRRFDASSQPNQPSELQRDGSRLPRSISFSSKWGCFLFCFQSQQDGAADASASRMAATFPGDYGVLSGWNESAPFGQPGGRIPGDHQVGVGSECKDHRVGHRGNHRQRIQAWKAFLLDPLNKAERRLDRAHRLRSLPIHFYSESICRGRRYEA